MKNGQTEGWSAHSPPVGHAQSRSESGTCRMESVNTFHSTRTRLRAGLRVSHGWRVCGPTFGLAVLHPREEPDALTSARPGPSGGYHASDIPTGISSSLTRELSILHADDLPLSVAL